MSELLFFVLGLIIGVLSGVSFICIMQVSNTTSSNIEVDDKECEKEM